MSAEVTEAELEDLLEKSKEDGKKLRLIYNEKEQISTSAFGNVEINNLEDIENTTQIGVKGLVTKAEPFHFVASSNEKSPYTKVSVQITEVLNGDSSLLNTEIDVYEAGGLISKSDMGLAEKIPDISQSELNKQGVINFDGVSNSMPGDEVVLFLVKLPGSSWGIQNDFYQIMGNHKTRFDKNDETNEYERVESTNNESNEDTITPKEMEILNEEINELVSE